MSALKLLADAFHEGGWPMWPILIIMVVAWGISIERAIYLRKAGIDKEKLLALLKSQIMAGNVQGAIKVCSGNPTPMTRIIAAGLTKFNRPDHEVQAAMDEAALKELPKLEKRTGYLAMLGTSRRSSVSSARFSASSTRSRVSPAPTRRRRRRSSLAVSPRP
jgi:biopolymer transport protein ExbB